MGLIQASLLSDISVGMDGFVLFKRFTIFQKFIFLKNLQFPEKPFLNISESLLR